ncbi:MAG: ABC transporter permease [Bacteroidota bacterium]
MRKDFFENIRIAWRSLRGQKLRTVLTVLIIGLGIMALVGIFAATDNFKQKIIQEFSFMGANTYTIQSVNSDGKNRAGKSIRRFERISYQETQEFKKRFEYGDVISISAFQNGIATFKYKSEKTNPNVRVVAGDENYLNSSGYKLSKGRNISIADNLIGSRVVILGNDVVKKIFINNENPINKFVLLGTEKYKVIGVLEPKGNSFGFSGDNMAIMPLGTYKLNYATQTSWYSISVVVDDPQQLQDSFEKATGMFRIIRGDRPGDEQSFRVNKSDSIANDVIKITSVIRIVAIFIAIITLFGAGIGLMNIMLVSVSERTREIGLRKSVGATNKKILNQFLFESVVIGQLGGLVGIILGLGLAALSGAFFGAFVFPWPWIIVAIIVCVIVAILSGIYPARKAAKLDPIESLRHE